MRYFFSDFFIVHDSIPSALNERMIKNGLSERGGDAKDGQGKEKSPFTCPFPDARRKLCEVHVQVYGCCHYWSAT